MSFLTSFNLAGDANLRNRVYGALIKAAGAILAEGVETANHAERVKFALDITGGDPTGGLVQEVTRLVADNVTVQVSAPDYVDSDLEFVVNSYGTDFLFKVQLRLGFRVNQRVNTYLYQIVADLVQRHQLAPQNHRYSIYREHSSVGDFRFCLLRKVLTPETDISGFDYRIMSLKYFIRRLCGSPARWYGLENSSIIFEYVPLFSKTKRQHKLKRIDFDEISSKAVDAGLTPEQRTAALDEEDEDIFMAAMHDERQLNAENVEAKLVGGDTASFKPLVLDEDSETDEELEEIVSEVESNVESVGEDTSA